MTTIDTARLRALAEAATPGKRAVAGTRILVDDVLGVQTSGPNWRNDQAYIAAADPQTMLALLDEIERLRGDTEWEHAVRNLSTGEVFEPVNGKWWRTTDNEESVRRRKAGPWERVEGETDES